MARKHPNPLDDPPPAYSSEEQEEAEETEEEDDQPDAQPDGSETEEGVEDGEEEEEEEEEEEDDHGDDDEEDEEEPKKEKSHPQSSQAKPVPKIPNPQEDEDDSETESDSDSKSPGVSGFTIRQHISKPAVSSPNSVANVKSKKAAVKSNLEKENPSSPVVVSLKRPAEGDLQSSEKESKSKVKKAKAENGGGGEEEAVSEKKSAINRLWSEEDEIAILKGMIQFHDKKGVDPNSDSTAFQEFVKKNLSVDVSKNQLMDKVRRLKKKYRNNAGKGNNGQDPVFSRPHELKAFELSKKIWGGGLGMENKKSPKKKNLVDENAKPKTESAKDNGSAGFVMALPKDENMVAVHNKEEHGKGQEGTFSQLYPFLNLSLKTSNFTSALISKDGAEAMEGCLRCMERYKLEELEEEWKKQILAEVDVYMGRSALLQKQVQLVSEWHAQRG